MQTPMKNTILPPYEIAQDPGGRPFLAFQTTDAVCALPWHDLKAIRLSPDGTQLTFEYTRQSAKLTGTGLGVIAELAFSSRLKRLRQGDSDEVRIDSVRIIGEETE